VTTAARWGDVAAPGTDPDRLAALVVALVTDLGALRQHVQATRDRGVVAAVRAATAAPAVDLDGAAAAVATDWARLGVHVALAGDPAYPARLRPDDVPAAPLFVAWRGAPPADGPAVAIVGSRRATAYGRGVAAWLAEAVAGAGVRVVSGGAVGIDAAAHAAALDAPGGTTVVLGCGHAVGYPAPHAAPDGLFDRVLAAGGTVLSELLPRATARPQHVRERNRIVAALSDAVVVVEGGGRSGALVTAGVAADLGVPVLAVPGDVQAPGSAAPHRLLAEGAGICTGPTDLLESLGQTATVTPRPAPVTGLPDPVAAALVERWPRAIDVDELARLAAIPAGALLAALTRARIAGTVALGPEGVRLRRAP
jgi:DNA processing protein